jgi:hypothetical protein
MISSNLEGGPADAIPEIPILTSVPLSGVEPLLAGLVDKRTDIRLTPVTTIEGAPRIGLITIEVMLLPDVLVKRGQVT